MLNKFSTLWRFLLPVLLLLAIAALMLVWQQTAQQLVTIEQGAKQQAYSLSQLLDVTGSMVSEKADTAMLLLKERAGTLGNPALKGRVTVNNVSLPNLVFGDTAVASSSFLIDGITDIFGGSATLFVKSGEAFYRLSTNIRQNGKRATGSMLDPDGKVIKAVSEGRSFQGMVNILGQPYLTRYDPMLDERGALIGIWSVGYRVDIQAIRDAVEQSRYLSSGFVAIVDDRNEIKFLSKHAPSDIIPDFIESPPADWMIVKEALRQWGFKIIVAYPLLEAYKAGLTSSILLISETTLLGVLLIVLILWQLRRLVIDPIGTDPATAIEVVQKIAKGDLEHDGLTAKPGTLMQNVINMREKLRKTLNVLRKNADGLRLSASVFQHAHDGIFITDARSRIVEINPAFTAISGYTYEDAIGRTPAELRFACDQPDLFDKLWRNTGTDADWKGESRNKRKSGEVYIASLDLFVVRDDSQQISHYVGVFSDISAEMAHRENLEHMAYHDALTQLPNRALLAERLHGALIHARHTGQLLAVCYFDLDNFKEVNDRYGHDIGDGLLVQFGRRMRDSLRQCDTLARMGGDEFALLLCSLDSRDECVQALNRLQDVIRQPFTLGDIVLSVSASMGYTLFPQDDSTPDTLLRHADHAMYLAKINGGSRHHLFDAEHDRLTRGQRQERERIEQALSANEFRLFYQPKVDMQRGLVVSMEALIRWQHPETGLRPPNDFLPQIENTDFIIALGEWVILEALRQMQAWQKTGLDIPVSVNIAAHHLMQADFAARLGHLLGLYPDVSPGKLELEITETAVIEDISGVTQIMQDCKSLGVTFALDDFGVGYSSLTYLRRLPIDIIKIDQSFVRGMLHDASDLTLIAGVISLSREFGRSVVAEGLETAEHGVQLLRMGCSVAQGFGIAPPMPAELVEKWAACYQPDKNWEHANWQNIHH